jgi:hypothetical protein
MGRCRIHLAPFPLLLIALPGAIAAFAPFANDALAYTPTLMGNGGGVRWHGEAKLNLAGNPVNRNGIDAGRFYAAAVRSLQRWQQASGGAATFDYWQGADRGIYEADSEYNGLSSLYFASNAQVDPHLSPNVLGLTQVWYNTDNGEIIETDIVLNDRDFRFTTDPRDTSGFGSSNLSYTSARNTVYIENVLTHELGHAFGLSHSGGLQSTMLFMESPEQAHLGCDEAAGIRAMYNSGGERGTITGSVAAESGAPVFGAHVVAISRRRGAVLATGLTDTSGRYRIGGLETGAYFLMVEPFFAGPSALPSYYAGINPAICPGGQGFGRSVLLDGASRPQAIRVGAGGTSGAPALVARCGNYGGAALSSVAGSARASTAPVIFDGTRDGGGFGAADKFGYSNTAYYKLNAVGGRIEVHGLSYSLYSPVSPTLTLLDSGGNEVTSARSDQQVYVGDSGYVNYDAQLIAEGLAAGDYVLEVSATPMDANRYPAPVSLDSVPFLVLTGSVNEGPPPLAGELPENARCRASENFAAYSSPGGNPPRRDTDEDGGGTGFCGTIATSDRHGDGGGSGPGPGAIAGWFAPWLAMALIARFAKSLARQSGSRRRGLAWSVSSS